MFWSVDLFFWSLDGSGKIGRVDWLSNRVPLFFGIFLNSGTFWEV